MTNLPVSESGEIIWREVGRQLRDVFNFPHCFADQAVHHMKMAAQHTRERAAKVAEDGAYISLSVAMAAMDGTGVEAAKIGVVIRDNIRKMEV